MLLEPTHDPELIAAYVRQGVTLDALPYTPTFEALFEEVINNMAPGTLPEKAPGRTALFHRLKHLQKTGRLPRLGRTPTAEGGPARLMDEQKNRLIMIVENKVGELPKYHQLCLLYTSDAADD